MDSQENSNKNRMGNSLNNCDDCKDRIIENQSYVSKCEAKLFCVITERLCCEVKRAKCLDELKYVVNIANSFLLASASKETAIANILSAYTCKCEKKCDCD